MHAPVPFTPLSTVFSLFTRNRFAGTGVDDGDVASRWHWQYPRCSRSTSPLRNLGILVVTHPMRERHSRQSLSSFVLRQAPSTFRRAGVARGATRCWRARTRATFRREDHSNSGRRERKERERKEGEGDDRQQGVSACTSSWWMGRNGGEGRRDGGVDVDVDVSCVRSMACELERLKLVVEQRQYFVE